MSTFSVKGVLSLDGSQFAGAMAQANRSVDRFASSVGGAVTGRLAALFSLGAAEEGIRRTIEFASHIQDLSQRLGVSVEWLQEMQYVMKQNGGTADDLAKTLEKIADFRRKSLAGSAQSPTLLATGAKLGLTPEFISSNGAQQIVEAVSKAFKAGGSTESLSSAFREIGGKGAKNLIATFVDGLEQGRAAARAAGAVMSEDTVAQLDDLGDQFTTMWQQLLVTIGPIILTIIKSVRDMFEEIRADALAAYGFLSKAGSAMMSFYKALAVGSPSEIKEAWKNYFKMADEGLDQARYNYKAQSGADKDAEIARDDAVTERQRNRRARNKADVIPYVPFQEKPVKMSIQSDALTSIGNFLGSNNQSLLTRLAQRQTDLLQSIDGNIRTLATQGATDSTGLE